MSDHTRGPWMLRQSRGGGVLFVEDAPYPYGQTLAQVLRVDGGKFRLSRDTFRANANLIVASPDLLAACRAAFEFMKGRGDPFTGADWALGHRISAAIGKAEGKL